MKALRLHALDAGLGGLRYEDVADPLPARGELLVRVRVAPVNPADVMACRGEYVVERSLPFTPGVTGVGEVVGGDGGVLGRALRGRRVVFATAPDADGSWAELAAVPAALCVPLPRGVSDEDAMNLLANGATAVGLVDELTRGGHQAVVLTAAAGDLAGTFVAEATRRGLTVIPVVRDERQASAVGARGLTALVSSHDDFAEALEAAAARHGATAAVDSVSGPMTGVLLQRLPARSTVIVLGRLSGQQSVLDPFALMVGREQQLRGFNVGRWLEQLPKHSQLRAVARARRLVTSGRSSSVAHDLRLQDAPTALTGAVRSTTNGKTVLRPPQRR